MRTFVEKAKNLSQCWNLSEKKGLKIKYSNYSAQCQTKQNVVMLVGINHNVESWIQMSTRTIATIWVKKRN